MKQISIAINIILIACIFCLGCKHFNVAHLPSTLDTSQCVTCNEPFQGVSAKDFMKVVARYRDTHWKEMNGQMASAAAADPTLTMANVDSRSVWFSLDTLKKFICYIERYSDSIHINKDSLGIRFYYAVYPGHQNSDFGQGYQTRLGQHTIYMVPTTVVQGEIEDFDPYLSNNAPLKSILYMKNLLNSSSDTSLLILGGSPALNTTPTGVPYIWNNGRLCPTNCPPAPDVLDIIDAQYPQVPY